eukprot:CAMPEP_0183795834 /NCGR_PEP_ID=MMETSP0803_2-20130417/5345_1 /TAXON_ID=195967 /ORGANISM="Crustomastix stigmata, Strain CCMP3273" /LENGTH=997 /DNA_ID=CAMNT_0026040337 /DNA_START=433 /DNA_END=3426 /DNA_ORIENTATION=-
MSSTLSVKKEATHEFNAKEQDWGFTQFLLLSDLHDASKGFLADDTLTVECEISVVRQPNHYNSRQETGYIGLKNQGATCYMNSLLQTLFHIPYFRKAVYHLPTTESDRADKSIPLALQSLFYKLQYSETSVATKDLTRSFGWDASDAFMQHDVQELNRVLCEKLEEKMKSTTVEGTIQKLFEGHMESYVECIDVNYKSSRKEPFLDLQLDVKGCKNVYESFDKYTDVEKLEGDNKYQAEGHGLQIAKKGVLFSSFPPVLELQLKRFEYDFSRDTNTKINQRYEFPLELDLDKDNFKYLSQGAGGRVRNRYLLHSVLVHSGGVHGGHYFAYIRPIPTDERWFKFDDERVTKESMESAVMDQFGGDMEPTGALITSTVGQLKLSKNSNAYMLVYVREADTAMVWCDVSEADLALHVRHRLQAEHEEKERKRREKQDAHLYAIVKIARDEDLVSQIGADRHFDLVDHDKCTTFRVPKHTRFKTFQQQVAQELGVPCETQRYWAWAKRQNHTYRPSRVLTEEEKLLSVIQLRDLVSSKNSLVPDLKLFLETHSACQPKGALRPILSGEILVFFKYFDPTTEKLEYAGHMFLSISSRMTDHTLALCKLVNLPSTSELLFFEEIKYEPVVMCEPIDHLATLKSCQLEDGDIICFQCSRTKTADLQGGRYLTITDFFVHLRNRQVITFRDLKEPKVDRFTVELYKTNTYDEVAQILAKRLGVLDPTFLKLTAHNCYSQTPKPQSIKFRGVEKLQDMLAHYNQSGDILYYEILDLPLPVLEKLKTLKVSFHARTGEQISEHHIRLPQDSSVEHALSKIRTELIDRGTEVSGRMRLMEIFYNKIYKVFEPSEKIDTINDQYWTLRAEEVPEEEESMETDARLIHIYHFVQESTGAQPTQHTFGNPVLLKLTSRDTLQLLKCRIRHKLKVAEAEFKSWNFCVVLSNVCTPLHKDDELVWPHFEHRRDNISAWEHYLGIEHEHVPKELRRNVLSSSRQPLERPIKIYG